MLNRRRYATIIWILAAALVVHCGWSYLRDRHVQSTPPFLDECLIDFGEENDCCLDVNDISSRGWRGYVIYLLFPNAMLPKDFGIDEQEILSHVRVIVQGSNPAYMLWQFPDDEDNTSREIRPAFSDHRFCIFGF